MQCPRIDLKIFRNRQDCSRRTLYPTMMVELVFNRLRFEIKRSTVFKVRMHVLLVDLMNPLHSAPNVLDLLTENMRYPRAALLDKIIGYLRRFFSDSDSALVMVHLHLERPKLLSAEKGEDKGRRDQAGVMAEDISVEDSSRDMVRTGDGEPDAIQEVDLNANFDMGADL